MLKPFTYKASSTQDYDPFGLVMPGRSFTAGSADVYKFGFNGKEVENQIYGKNSALEFGARIYNPKLSIFLSVDKYNSLFTSSSPYTFAGNNPVKFIDAQGNFKLDPYFIIKYPALAIVLEKYAPLIAMNEKAMHAWTEITGLSNQDFISMTTWGEGPWVTPTRISCSDDNYNECNGPCDNYIDGLCFNGAGPGFENFSDGQYDNDSYPENLFINYERINALEKAANQFLETGDFAMLNFQVFYIMTLIMHESTHWGVHHSTNSNKYIVNEIGAQWEKSTFGVMFRYNRDENDDFNSEWRYWSGYLTGYLDKHPESTIAFGLTLASQMHQTYNFTQKVKLPKSSERDPSLIKYPPRDESKILDLENGKSD